MHIRAMLIIGFVIFVALPLAGDQNPVFLEIAGKQLYVGMPQANVVAALSKCCNFSVRQQTDDEKQRGVIPGQPIFSISGSTSSWLGMIYFQNGRVVRITRQSAREIDISNEEVINLARAIKRALPIEAKGIEMNARVRLQHYIVGGTWPGESDVISIVFPDGRGVELSIDAKDRPDQYTGIKDSVGLLETLESSR